jgi:hypothetical protein
MEHLALIEMVKRHLRALLALIVIVRSTLLDMVVARMEIIGKDLLHLANDPSSPRDAAYEAAPRCKLALSPKGDIAVDSFQIRRLREMQRMKKPPRRKLAVSPEDWLLFLEANTPISFSRT